jgi:hypothetical protein
MEAEPFKTFRAGPSIARFKPRWTKHCAVKNRAGGPTLLLARMFLIRVPFRV